jgi:hypothetical protein
MGKYNGWTNRATWLVNLHFGPETKEDVNFIRNNIEEMFDEMCKGNNYFMRDILNDFESDINWDEIKEHLDEIEKHQEVK